MRPRECRGLARCWCQHATDFGARRPHYRDRADNVLGDGIFALKLGETLLVKTVVCRGKDTFDLVSDNPACGNIHVDLTKDRDHLNVIGRVTAHWRTL
jgi:phage repressor protein C with HTH and peptisase S24 domain